MDINHLISQYGYAALVVGAHLWLKRREAKRKAEDTEDDNQ